MTTIENIHSESSSSAEDNETLSSSESSSQISTIHSMSKDLYDKPVIKLEFKTETEYQDWMENIANKQGIWGLKNNYNKVNAEREELLAEGRFLKNSQTYCCDHYGKPRKSRAPKEKLGENNEPVAVKTRKRGPSKKVLCRAHFCKKLFTNGEVEIMYHWQHINHNALLDVAIRDEKAKRVMEKEQELIALQNEVLDEVKRFEETVHTKLNEYKANPQKLKELKETLKRGLDDLSKYLYPPNIPHQQEQLQ